MRQSTLEVHVAPTTISLDIAPPQVTIERTGGFSVALGAIVGPPGPSGPTGPAGPSGDVERFYGVGPPGVVIGASPGDEYVDTDTGDLYVLN